MNRIVLSLACSALAIALAAAPAMAQTPVTTPTGPRAEVLVGYDALRVDLEEFGVDEKLKDNDAFYGIGAGYDFAVSPSVSVGADLEVSDSNNKADFDEGEENAEVRTGRDLYAGGRVTFPVSNAANLYVKGGYTNLKIKGEANGVDDSAKLDGWRVGAGGQFNITGPAYLGGEYRFSKYESDVSRHQLAATLGVRF